MVVGGVGAGVHGFSGREISEGLGSWALWGFRWAMEVVNVWKMKLSKR
jgi:hypothetical protein